MLKDLDKRREFWDVNHSIKQQGDSLACPFQEYMNLFCGKDVLEIGPGGGRQYLIVRDLVHSYSIADISQSVLNEDIYCNIDKYLLEDYNKVLGRFDVIHFWYVLHHMLPNELYSLVNFLYLNLRQSGIVVFNTAYLFYDSGNYNEDGIKTTKMSIEFVESIFSEKFKLIVKDNSKYTNSNGTIAIGIKKWVS